jgi:hypothetical protein
MRFLRIGRKVNRTEAKQHGKQPESPMTHIQPDDWMENVFGVAGV